MIGGHIVIQDEVIDGKRQILAGTLFGDGMLFFDRIEDAPAVGGVRRVKQSITMDSTEVKEFYKQLKELMEG